MDKGKLRGNLLMLFVSIIFGLNISVSKSLLASGLVQPEALTLARMVFAGTAFWIASVFMPREHVTLRDQLILLLGSMCGITFNQGMFIFGLNMTSPIDASIIVTSTPMLAMILAAFILKEPITVQKAAGVVVGAVGAIALITTAQNQVVKASSLSGNLLVFASSCIYSLYLVCIKPVIERYSAVTVMKWMFLYASLMMAPFMLKSLINAPIFTQAQSIQPFLSLFYTLFGATFLTYLLIPMAQRLIRPTTIGMYNYVQPLVATIAAVIIGQDRLTWVKVGCALLIFVGVYMVTKSKSRQQVLEEERKRALGEEK